MFFIDFIQDNDIPNYLKLLFISAGIQVFYLILSLIGLLMNYFGLLTNIIIIPEIILLFIVPWILATIYFYGFFIINLIFLLFIIIKAVFRKLKS